MPGKRKYERKTKRKKYKGKRRMLKKLPLTGFPSSKMVKLRYTQQFSLNPGANNKIAQVFRANDMYDPDVTGTGHQPVGFDQWVGVVYDHFTVVGARISVTAVPSSVTNVTPGYWGILVSDTGTAVSAMSSVTSLLESKYTGKSVNIYGLVNGPKHPTISRNFSSKKFFGVKTGLVGDTLYRGGVSISPAEQAYFEVFGASVNGNDPGSWNFIATIDYIAVLTEPKALASS